MFGAGRCASASPVSFPGTSLQLSRLFVGITSAISLSANGKIGRCPLHRHPARLLVAHRPKRIRRAAVRRRRRSSSLADDGLAATFNLGTTISSLPHLTSAPREQATGAPRVFRYLHDKMAAQDGTAAPLLGSATMTRIAQLAPDLDKPSERAISGEITVTWPYNSVKHSFAFLLAEGDARLRRKRGQVRIQLSGPSAKAVADTGLGAGDELVLGLRGVEWAKDDSIAPLPESRLEWQLRYSGELVMQVMQ